MRSQDFNNMNAIPNMAVEAFVEDANQRIKALMEYFDAIGIKRAYTINALSDVDFPEGELLKGYYTIFLGSGHSHYIRSAPTSEGKIILRNSAHNEFEATYDLAIKTIQALITQRITLTLKEDERAKLENQELFSRSGMIEKMVPYLS